VGFARILKDKTAKSMEAFSKMSDAQKTAAVEKSRTMQTRAEMERFVNSLGE